MKWYNPDAAEFLAMVIVGIICVAILFVISWIVESCGGTEVLP